MKVGPGGRMQAEITSAASAIFAANRARGSVTFDVHLAEGVTRRRHLHESGSLRVRFPSPEADGLSAVFVNTAGGVAGGDRFDIDITAGEGSRLVVTTAAAEKIYRAEGPAAQLNIALKAADGAHLGWLPQETILFDRARVVAPDRYRSGGERFAAALRNRGVRPRGDGRAHVAGRIRRPLALAARRQAGVRGNVAARRRHRREAGPGGGREGRCGHRHRADGAGRRGPGRTDPRACRNRSAARSASPPGMGLQWRASAPKMRPGFAPT